jgi:hypothetical protein
MDNSKEVKRKYGTEVGAGFMFYHIQDREDKIY